MEWYIPILGVGLIIMSTSNIMLALNVEISELEHEENRAIQVINAKLSQLKKLSISIVFQYIGVLLFLFLGILKSIFEHSEVLSKWLLFIGVLVVSVSILIFLAYYIKVVTIKQKHLKQ